MSTSFDFDDLSSKFKQAICCYSSVGLIVSGLFAGLCLGYSIHYQEDSDKCGAPIGNWVFWLGVLYASKGVKDLVTLMCLCGECVSTFNIKSSLLAEIFSLGWFFYGNTFHYTDEAFACRQISSGMNSLWCLEMFFIAVGYAECLIAMVWSFCVCNGNIASRDDWDRRGYQTQMRMLGDSIDC
ncbi:hypothetical protein FGO68_gene9663 [Halteria grandinella]|uniref:Uncharacterized protein n=1 Tax=Halteria grandinella TaxID=5974 RepID=A0A8J8NIK5_HALGN|nr:hypothetical protein FGO68_gene9663 [Halteria grandinella]